MPTRLLVSASAVILLATGLGYLLAPGAALGIVGVEASSTTEFLLRTEGVAVLFGAAMLVVVRNRQPAVGLAGYYVLGSVVDGVAFAQGIVAVASVPSVVVRVAIRLACVAAAWRPPR